MATTGIWKISKRLDHVIDYVMDVKKTARGNIENYQLLHQFKKYENMDYNTEESCYISGINCLPHRAYKNMLQTKEI